MPFEPSSKLLINFFYSLFASSESISFINIKKKYLTIFLYVYNIIIIFIINSKNHFFLNCFT